MLDRLYEAFFVKKREVIPPFRLGRIFVLARRVHPAIAAGLAGAFVLFLINYDYFLTYLRLPLPAGFDGASHLAAGIEYAKNIFPSFWGWTPKWQLGMPFPVFYPPLFYFVREKSERGGHKKDGRHDDGLENRDRRGKNKKL